MTRRDFFTFLSLIAATGPVFAHDGHSGAALEFETISAVEEAGQITLSLRISNTGTDALTIAGFDTPIAQIAGRSAMTVAPGQTLRFEGADALRLTDLTRTGLSLFTLMVVFDTGDAGPVTIFMTSV